MRSLSDQMNSHPSYVFAWLLFWVLASVVYRRLVGKPILFFNLPSASFLERAVSGHSNDNILRQLGGARSCLVVGIVEDRFVVRPFFPFNLLFLPEIYGLEHDLKISKITGAQVGKFLFWKKLVVTFLDGARGTRSMTLYLKDPETLAKLLGSTEARDGA